MAGPTSQTPIDAADGDGPLARALGYPYPRASGPVLFTPGAGARAARLVGVGPGRERTLAGLAAPVAVRTVAFEAEGRTVEIADVVALVAAGSNGSATQLARKYRDRRSARPILIVPAAVSGAVSVYSAHITAYGSVPATLHPASGAAPGAGSAFLHVLMLPAEELAHMNATESLGVNYVLAAPAGLSAKVMETTIERPLAYVSLRGALALDGAPVLLPDTGGAETGHPVAAQADMLGRVARHAGHTGDIGDFIRRMVADRAARLAVTERLAEAGLRWVLDRDEIVAGG